MEIYEGIVKDRVVLLPEDVHLDEGLRVEVRVSRPEQESREETFKKRLVEAGLITRIRKPSWPLAEEDRIPIQVKGQPLSEQIVEERR